MKKFTIVILAVTALLLSAFAGSYSQVLGQTANSASVEATTTPETGNPGNAPKDGGERPISDQEKFIIGVFKIEGTDLAVTAEQAASLIPLWTSMEEYSQQPQPMPAGTPAATPDASATPAEPVDHSEEISALFGQIETVMTADQLAAITKLELNQDAVKTFMDEQGIEMPAGMQPGQNGQPSPDGTPAANQQPAPQGTPSADQQPASQQGTPAAGGQQPGNNGQQGQMGQPESNNAVRVASQSLIDALIKLLESKAS